ncbi:MAG: hypothetical protein LBQ60_04445 [Bacteroidales bacterium]|jgi:hypothetical protein|nr:hypothetical protein [Bacteroidales bacterium]
MCENSITTRDIGFFKSALESLMNRKQLQKEEIPEYEFDAMYDWYIEKERAFFLSSGKCDVLSYFSDEPEDLRKAEMLALLLYHDGMMHSGIPAKKNLFEKSWLLYQYVCAMYNDFSYDRMKVIKKIEKQWLAAWL